MLHLLAMRANRIVAAAAVAVMVSTIAAPSVVADGRPVPDGLLTSSLQGNPPEDCTWNVGEPDIHYSQENGLGVWTGNTSAWCDTPIA